MAELYQFDIQRDRDHRQFKLAMAIAKACGVKVTMPEVCRLAEAIMRDRETKGGAHCFKNNVVDLKQVNISLGDGSFVCSDSDYTGFVK